LSLNKKLIVTFDIVRSISHCHGINYDWKEAGKNEGWQITRIPGCQFAHEVTFDSDDDKIMFFLKYGVK
jgi:hypothetical protein